MDPDYFMKSVLVPIAVAVATTLVLEWFAKPRLEARKARLIRDRQQIDEVVFAFQRLAADLGSIPETAPPGTQQEDVRRTLAKRANESSTRLLDSLSLLSPRYVAKYGTHIGKCARHIGYVYAVTDRVMRGGPAGDNEFHKMADGLEKLDVHFRVYIGFMDSQEPLVKRLVYRIAHREQ